MPEGLAVAGALIRLGYARLTAVTVPTGRLAAEMEAAAFALERQGERLAREAAGLLRAGAERLAPD